MQHWPSKSDAPLDDEFQALTLNRVQEYALFEPGCRHIGKDIMGTNKANPVAMILSGSMLLRHLGYVASRAPCDAIRRGYSRDCL